MAKAIMIQGTSSGVGKSVLAIALCRILKEEGYRVAPFKSQNMSSNTHCLPDGRKIARSQAVAAYASGVQPTKEMNPILMVPLKGQGAEVFVRGSSQGIMGKDDYDQYKKQAFQQVLEAYEQLANEYDVVVIEGAGSPVEMNLLKDDIANMGLAEALQCPVILVGDIQRGGVFASLYGTLMLLSASQRDLVKGMIVNKFIGQEEYFQEGKQILEEICGKKLLGTVPFTNIAIEDEDILFTKEASVKTRTSFGFSEEDSPQYFQWLEGQFAFLSEHIRKHLSIGQIEEMMGLGH